MKANWKTRHEATTAPATVSHSLKRSHDQNDSQTTEDKEIKSNQETIKKQKASAEPVDAFDSLKEPHVQDEDDKLLNSIEAEANEEGGKNKND